MTTYTYAKSAYKTKSTEYIQTLAKNTIRKDITDINENVIIMQIECMLKQKHRNWKENSEADTQSLLCLYSISSETRVTD